MQPYYNKMILPDVFLSKGIIYAKWIVVFGGLAGLSASLIGAIYPLPVCFYFSISNKSKLSISIYQFIFQTKQRVLYSMSMDGLIFKFLSKVNKKTKVPIIGTLISGFLAGLISAVFNLKELADMMSIGTLLAYTLVALSVTILRYRKDSSETATNNYPSTTNCLSEEDLLDEEKLDFYSLYSFNNLLNADSAKEPTTKTSYISSRLILILTIIIVLLDGAVNFQLDKLLEGDPAAYVITGIIFVIFLFFFCCLYKQPMVKRGDTFEVPFVPIIPLISVWVNVLLMFNLSGITWLR